MAEYPYEYCFTIIEPYICEQKPTFEVLMVQVAPQNKTDRDLIYSTWGSESPILGRKMKEPFLLGMQTREDAQKVHEQLLRESQEHRP